MTLNPSLFSSKTDMWATPQKFFDDLNSQFGFTLDPCATHENHKCAKYYTEEQDGLKQSWDNEIVFCNPPYGKTIGEWIKKASEARGGGSCDAVTSKDRHSVLPRLHIPQSRGALHQRAVKVWGQQKFCSIPKYGRHIQTRHSALLIIN